MGTLLCDLKFKGNPVAHKMEHLLSPRQSNAIMCIARAKQINTQRECQDVLKCDVDKLTKRAASFFIDYLKSK